MIVERCCVTGEYHKLRKEECQDVAEYYEGEDYAVAVIADGVTACNCSAEGARIACKAVADFVTREKQNIFKVTDDKLSYRLIEHILCFLEEEANRTGDDLFEYASTVAGAIINKKNGSTLLFNLGDGEVFSLGPSFYGECLKPRLYGGNPCFTTTKDAHKAMSVKRTGCWLGDGFLLCTDGFLNILNGTDECASKVKRLIEKRNFKKLNKILNGCREKDDCSYIAIIFNR